MKQKGFFDESCEDLPLMSGTPMRAEEENGASVVVFRQPPLPFKCWMCRDTGKIEFALYCTCEAGQKRKDSQRIIAACMAVSGGTLATMTGLTRYDEVFNVQSDWVTWVANQWETHYEFWQDAWQAWVEAEHPEWRGK